MKLVFVVFSFILGFLLYFSEIEGHRFKRHDADKNLISDKNAEEYLSKFGYIVPENLVQSVVAPAITQKYPNTRNPLIIGITLFQQFMGLEETGEFDDETKEKMAQPRCGVPDIHPANLRKGWDKKHLTYKFYNYSPDLPREDIKKSIRRAFDHWSTFVPIDFTETLENSSDIKIKFESQNQCFLQPFDGPHGILAHATIRGDLHFDEDETWKNYLTFEKYDSTKVDLFTVALHEIGHVLGLDHSRQKGSIMQANYYDPVNSGGRYIEPRLTKADIQDIEELYGERETCETENGKTIRDSNLIPHPGQLGECCSFCKATHGCKAFVWDDFRGGMCWLKSAIGPIIEKEGSSIGFVNKSCKHQKNQAIRDSDLTQAKGQLSDCCDICRSTLGCKGYVWNDFRGGTCWLKAFIGPIVEKEGSFTGIM